MPYLVDESSGDHAAHAGALATDVHPGQPLRTHEVPLAVVAEEEHGALLGHRAVERTFRGHSG